MNEPDGDSPRNTSVVPNTNKAVLVFVLGIIAFVALGLLVGIPAWVVGRKETKRIKAGRIARHQLGLLRAGTILGILGTFITTFFMIDVFLYFLVDIVFP